MKIEEYLNRHTVIKIGCLLSGYICCETIVDNPFELILVVQENACYISEIRWWDRVEIGTKSYIGYGGPRDPANPDTFYFAETDIFKNFDIDSQYNDYYKYLDHIKSSYPEHDLFPSFDVKKLGSK